MLKGVIWKDLYAVRFPLILGTLLTLFPNILLARMGGETYASGTGNEITGIILYVIANYIAITISTSFALNTLEEDIVSGWVKIQRTMPLTGNQIIGGKLSTELIVIGIMTALTTIFNLIINRTFGLPIEAMIAIPLCCACMQIAALSPTFPTAMKLGVKYTNALYLGFEIMSAMVFGFCAFQALSNELPLNAIKLALYIGLPMLAAISLTLSYVMGRKTCLNDI